MKIFDEQIKEDLTPSEFSESYFEYFCRSTRPVILEIKNLIENWFEKYPKEHKSELRNNLRLKDDLQFLGAFFELYCHELLLRHDYKVKIHEKSDKNRETRPDFEVYRDGKLEFYLEATVRTDKERFSTIDKHKNTILDYLNKNLKANNYVLKIKFISTNKKNPKLKKIKEEIEREVTKAKDFEEFDLVIDDWSFKIIKIETKKEYKRPIGFFGGVVQHIQDVEPVLKNLKNKATKYGDFNVPYIIAINTVGFFVDNTDIHDALYAKTDPNFDKENNKIILIHTLPRDGLWINKKGKIHNTRVSGVLSVIDLDPSLIAKREPILWHNPWAKKEIEKDLFKITQRFYDCEKRKHFSDDGLDISEIFGINQEWPET